MAESTFKNVWCTRILLMATILAAQQESKVVVAFSTFSPRTSIGIRSSSNGSIMKMSSSASTTTTTTKSSSVSTTTSINSVTSPRRMQRIPSSSRLFAPKPSSTEKHRLMTLLKSSIPADYIHNNSQQPYDNDNTSSVWSNVQQKMMDLTPTAIQKRLEKRRRLRIYKELQVTSRVVGSSSTVVVVVVDDDASDTGTDATAATSTRTTGLSKMDIALFATYFCNMMVVTLSVVTVPAIAMEYHCALSHKTATTAAAFVAGVASMAPLGGGIGKIINGFVCQKLGGKQASWIYLLGLSTLSMSMSMTKSLAPIGLLLIGYEFLSSIQWTSICHVLDQHYRQKPQLMARGIALLSLSSTLGALAAKTVGAGLLQATNWRIVCRFGSMAALFGAGAMYLGVKDQTKLPTVTTPEADNVAVDASSTTKSSQSPLAILKSILGNKLFWMVGIAHSLGHLAKGSDRLIGPFLQEATSLSGTLAAGLTSSVTVGMVFGLIQGRIFSKMDSVKHQMSMIKKNYAASLIAILGLAFCGLNSVTKLVNSSNLIAAGIALFSGIMASTVSFQFYQFPNFVSANIFPDNSAVSLSLIDAAGFFVTAQVLSANNLVLGKMGWSASWTFLAMIFGLFGCIMTRAIQPVLVQAQENQKLSLEQEQFKALLDEQPKKEESLLAVPIL